MKILHIPCAYYPVRGGTELRVQRISETLASWGHEVTVLTSNVTAISDYYGLDGKCLDAGVSEINKIRVIRVAIYGPFFKLVNFIFRHIRCRRIKDKLVNMVKYAYEARYIKKTKNYIKALAPDIVMATPHYIPNVKAAVYASKVVGFPFVMVPCLHEDDKCWPKDAVVAALKSADFVLAMTAYEFKRLYDGYFVEKNRMLIAGMGVDFPVLADVEINRKEQRVLFLGRQNEKKGIPLLIAAMQQVWIKYPSAKLVLAGKREVETEAIEEILLALPHEQRSKIESRYDITDAEKDRLLSCSTCLVLPSRIESFGGVILEAWANALPVVTLDLPLYRSFITPEEEGILVPPNNPEALSEAICKLFANPEFGALLGSAGYKKAKEMFTWEKVSANYLEGYKRAIALHQNK